MTTILPSFIEQAAGAGKGQGLAAEAAQKPAAEVVKQGLSGKSNGSQISAFPAFPPMTLGQ